MNKDNVKQIQEFEVTNPVGIAEDVKGLFKGIKEHIDKGNEEQRLKLEAEDRRNLEKAKERLAVASPLDVLNQFSDIYADHTLNNILKQEYGETYTKGSSSLAQTMLGVSTAEEQEKLIDEGLEALSPAQLTLVKEQAQDRMNSIKRFLENEQGARKVQEYLKGDNLTDEEFENFKSQQLDEYARLEMVHKASVASLGVALNEAGFIRRNITAKAHNVLVDVLDVTDLGDIASGIRIGAFTASALTGGATEFSLAGLKAVALTEGTVGAIEGTVDTMRDIEADPDTNVATSFAKNWGINTAMNIGTRYAFAGLGKAIGKGVEKLKGRKVEQITEGIADGMSSPNIKPDDTVSLKANELTEGYISPDVESVPLVRSTENAYDKFLGDNAGVKITSSAGVYDGQIKVDTFEDINSVYFGEKSLALNVGETVPSERGAMAEAVEEIAKKRGIANPTPEKNISIAGEPETINVAKRKILSTKEKQMKHYQDIAFNQGREVAEYAQKTGMGAEQLVAPTSESSKTFVQNIKRIFQDAERVVDDQMYSKIVALGGQDGISNVSDFFGMARQYDINLDKAFYTGELGVEVPEGFKKVFSYFRKMYNENVVGSKASVLYDSTNELVVTANELGIKNKLFKVAEFTPEGWNFSDAPLRINPDINPESLRGIINESLTPQGIVESLTETMALKQVPASEGLISDLLQNVNVDGKVASPKAVESLLRANGVPEGSSKEIAKEMTKFQNLAKADKEKLGMIVDAINEEIKVKQGLENRIFSFASKKDILSAKSFRIEKTGTVTDRVLPVEEALARMTPEDQKIYKEIIQKFKNHTSQVDVNGENAYNLLSIERASGKSTAGLDIRTSDIGEIAKAKGIKWKELTPEQKIDFADKVLGEEVLPQQLKKIGKSNMTKNGISTAEENIRFYIDKWKVADDVEIKFNRGAKKFGAGVTEPSEATGGKYIFRVDAPAGMDEEVLIGVTRHELQHIYDHKFLKQTTPESFKFKNKPTLKGTDVEFKIKNGEKVSVREAVGDYYNNHFYSLSNDNFESSYLTAQMRDRYNTLSDDDRFLGFINYIERSRQNIREGKVSTKDIYQYSKGSIPIEEFGKMEAKAGSRVVDDGFALKTFRNHEEFEGFIFDLADTLGKRKNIGSPAERFMNKFDAIKNDMVNRQVGYNKNDIVNALNTNKVTDMLHESGLSGKLGDDVAKTLGAYRTALQTTGKLYGEIMPDFTNAKIVEGYITSSLIGNRWFKDAVQANVNLATSYVNNGDYKRAFVEMFKLFPNTAKYFGQSMSRITGGVTLNINDATKYILSDIAGFNYEGRLLAHMGDYLTRVGNIGNKNLNVNKVQAFNQDMLNMAMAGAGISDKSFKAFSKRVQARSLSGLVTDDIVGNIQAKGWAKQEVLSMLEAPSYEALTEIQKKMYAFSGFKRENFSDFIKVVGEQAKKTKGLDYIPSQFAELKTTLNAGVNELDLVGRVQNTIKGERNTFDYMMSTTKGMLLDSLNKVQVKSYNGVYMNKAFDKQAILKLSGYAMAGSIGATQVAGASWLYTSIKNREFQIKSADDFYEEWTTSPMKKTKELAEAIIDQTSFGMIASGSKAVSLPFVAGGEMLEQARKKSIPHVVNVFGSALYGATYSKLIKDFALNNDTKSTTSYIKTPKFKNELNKEFQKNFIEQYPKAHKQIKNVYMDELRRDKDIYNFTRVR